MKREEVVREGVVQREEVERWKGYEGGGGEVRVVRWREGSEGGMVRKKWVW